MQINKLNNLNVIYTSKTTYKNALSNSKSVARHSNLHSAFVLTLTYIFIYFTQQDRKPFYGNYPAQPALAGILLENWRI